MNLKDNLTVEQIKEWLCDEEVMRGTSPSKWAVTQENLTKALLSVKVPVDQTMFQSADPALQIISELTDNYADAKLVIEGDAAEITNMDGDVFWRGYYEDAALPFALILLILCMKCYPEDISENSFPEGHIFYARAID
jgi:hypothetical protein